MFPLPSDIAVDVLFLAPQIGAYHTLDLELNQVFSIEKDVWDVIHLERIETSSDPSKKVGAVATVVVLAMAVFRVPRTHSSGYVCVGRTVSSTLGVDAA